MKILIISIQIVFLSFVLTPFSAAQHQEQKKVDVSIFKKLKHSDKFKDSTRVLTVKFHPDGSRLMVGGLSNKITVYDVKTGNMRWQVEGTNIEPMASDNLLSSKPYLVVAQNKWVGGDVYMYDWENAKKVGSLKPYAGGRYGIATNIGIGKAYIGWCGPEGKVYLFEASQSKVIDPNGYQDHPEKATALCFGPYGSVFSSGRVKVVKNSVYKNNPEVLFTGERPMNCLAANPFIKGVTDRVWLAIGENKGRVVLYDVPKKKVMHTFNLEKEIVGLKFHPTDKDLLIACGRFELAFYDVTQKKILRKESIDQKITAIDVSLDGSKIALGLDEGGVIVFLRDE